jgi:hypothetical protein
VSLFLRLQDALRCRRQLSRHPLITKNIRKVALLVFVACKLPKSPLFSFLAQQYDLFACVFQHWTAMVGPASFGSAINIDYYVRYFGCCARILMPEEEFTPDDMAVRLCCTFSACFPAVSLNS